MEQYPENKEQEAIEILSQLLKEFNQLSPPMEPILRQCQHICQILGWKDKQLWFYRELNGYLPEVPRPPYRMIQGKLIWELDHQSPNYIKWYSESFVYGKDPEDAIVENTILDCYGGLQWIISSSQNGYYETTNEKKTSSLRSGEQVILNRKRVFQGQNFHYCLGVIKQCTFDFISHSYSLLKYGQRMQSVWETRKSKIDEVLQLLGFHNHLSEIENSLNSLNPESWRTVAYACRSLLSDLADYLWKDPRKTYIYLQGKAANGKLSVSKREFANRIAAYLHQKGLSESPRKYLENELERLSDSIRSLIEYQSIAHGHILRSDAESIAIATYFLIGEITTKTDMQPVLQYIDPFKFINIDINNSSKS